MRFVVDHFILFARVLFTIRLDPFCCAVWCVCMLAVSQFLGQNVLFCAQRYHRSINDVIYNQVNSCIITFAYNSGDYETHLAANMLTEALILRDRVYCFSNGFSLSFDELNDIIKYICVG